MDHVYWITGLIVAAPLIVYLTVKLGVYAFYRGRQVFLDEQRHKEQANGKG